jgi:hypothetical protein
MRDGLAFHAAALSSEQILVEDPDREPGDLSTALGSAAREIDHPPAA